MNVHCSIEVTAIKSLSKYDLNWRELQGSLLPNASSLPQFSQCRSELQPWFSALRRTPANIKQKLPVLSWADKSLSCEKCSLGMSRLELRLHSFLPPALLALEHGEKPCLWNSGFKGNGALLSFPSRVANHNTASRISRGKSHGDDFKQELLPHFLKSA